MFTKTLSETMYAVEEKRRYWNLFVSHHKRRVSVLLVGLCQWLITRGSNEDQTCDLETSTALRPDAKMLNVHTKAQLAECHLFSLLGCFPRSIDLILVWPFRLENTCTRAHLRNCFLQLVEWHEVQPAFVTFHIFISHAHTHNDHLRSALW